MNLPPRWVPYLAKAGYECAHWSEIGPNSAPDEAICEHARRFGFVILTNDLDFPQILSYTREAKPSVVLLRGEPLTPELRGLALVNLIASRREELDSGAIMSIDWSDKVRSRLLPLK